MFEGYDYEDYFEPGIIDQIVIDAIAKAKEQIKESVKVNLEAELTKNKTEKERLDKVKKDLNIRIREVSHREREVEERLKDINSTSLRKVIEDRLHLDFFNFYTISWEHKDKPKCDKCDNDRQLQSFKKDGTEHSKYRCECYGTEKFYVTNEVNETKLYVGKKRYFNKEEQETFYVSMWQYDWDDSYSSLKIERIDLITTLEQAIATDTYYGIVLETKGLAQQYCDYLNAKDNR